MKKLVIPLTLLMFVLLLIGFALLKLTSPHPDDAPPRLDLDLGAATILEPDDG